MIIFFTFDIGLIFAVVVMFGAIIVNGVTDTVVALLSHYAPIMKTVLIISIIVAVVVGFIDGYCIEDDKDENRFKTFLSGISSGVYNGLVVPPVVLLAFHGILMFLDYFSDGFSVALMIIFGFLILIIYAVIITLVLLVGLAVPLLIKIGIFTLNGILGKLFMVVIGVGIACLYYFILSKEGVYPFLTEFV